MTRSLIEFTKPGITRMVVLTAAAGYLLGMTGSLDILVFIHTLVGTALVASGTNALNQWLERDADALMHRTRNRPIPSGRLAAGPALVLAIGLSLAGVGQLYVFVHPLPALLAAITALSYGFVYTPLKRRTSLSTLIGSVPGALPILGGWAAARGTVDLGGWMLFAILFLWQVPHFLALGWLYREDYRRGGFRLLAVIDPDGGSSGRQALLYAGVLVPSSVLPAMWGLAGGLYLTAALVAGLTLVMLAAGFARQASVARARRLFLGSLAYLPLVLAAMVLDKVVG
ncbi:MAG TPA: heme o synthase [Gemmatimonadales bacterium]